MEDVIQSNEQQVTRELEKRGIASAEHIEREVVVQKGRTAGCVIRYFFKQEAQAVLAFGESIIKALTGFGRVIRRLSGDGQEDEAVLEVSFRF